MVAARTRARRFLPFLVVLGASLPILFAPAPDVPAAASRLDKVVHIGLFAALLVTATLVATVAVRVVARAAVLLLGYAAVSEIVQALPAIGRTTSLTDWLADAVGVAVGAAAVLVVRASR